MMLSFDKSIGFVKSLFQREQHYTQSILPEQLKVEFPHLKALTVYDGIDGDIFQSRRQLHSIVSQFGLAHSFGQNQSELDQGFTQSGILHALHDQFGLCVRYWQLGYLRLGRMSGRKPQSCGSCYALGPP